MKISLETVRTRVLMVVCWVVIIFSFLYLSFFTQFVHTKKSVSLLLWPMIVDTKVLNEFEKKTGIKVYVSYYESGAELYTKLKASGGRGYDLIAPSDYLVEKLIKDGLVQKLDKSKLPFLPALQPQYLGHYFDPANEYSIPYYTGIFGLGINRSYFQHAPVNASWALLFDRHTLSYPLCMTDDARQAVLLASYYLYGSIDAVRDEGALVEIRDLLRTQKKWVDVYTDARVDELLASGSCPVALGLSTDVYKIKRLDANIDFIVPPGKTIVAMESFVIPAKSRNSQLVYELLNFLYRPDILAHNSKLYGFCSPLSEGEAPSSDIVCLPRDTQEVEFLRNVISEQELQKLWISILS